jgi:NitT/TauT family transport system substrate-binding protein
VNAAYRDKLGPLITPSGRPPAPDLVDSHVSARVRARRRELKITRDTAARALRISVAQLDRLEKGRVSIEARQIDRLCTLLDVTPSYFFHGLLPAAGDSYVWRTERLGEDPMFARALAFAAALTATALPANSTTAHAEAHEIVFARLGSFAMLPLIVMESEHLVEKQAKKLGLDDLKVSFVEFNSGFEVNSALASGRAQFGASSVAPFLTLWDKAQDNLKIKAVSALDTAPMFLVSRNPHIKKITDFTDADRINVLTPGSAGQAIVFEMAVAQAYGIKNYAKLDPLTVGLPPSEAIAALISGSGAITADFTGLPMSYLELDTPGVHKVLGSNDVLGGEATNALLYTTAAFHAENPKIMTAVNAALDEAMALIAQDRQKAGDTYLRITGMRYVKQVGRMVADPLINFRRDPHKLMTYANFMRETGKIKNAPLDWKGFFFAEEAARFHGD